MQTVLMYFYEAIRTRSRVSGCSFAAALEAQLRNFGDPRALLTLRDAALDLVRVVELEVQRREEVEELPPSSSMGPEVCGSCGGAKPAGQSCGCFDNNSQ